MAEMFDQLVHPPASVGSRRYTLPVSILIHTAIVGAVVVVPLLATDVIPSPRTILSFASPPALPSPPAVRSAPAVRTPTPVATAPSVPMTAPPSIEPEGPPPVPSTSMVAGVPGGLPGLPGDAVNVGAPPPPVAPRLEPVRIGGLVKPPVNIHHVNPVYPPVALAAKVSGEVDIEATIGTDGSVMGARVTRSIPLLDTAALAAVRQWRFTPTTLNGTPVPVIMTVKVTFALQ